MATMDRIMAEGGENQTMMDWFFGWRDAYKIDLGDLGIPQTIVSWITPENSLNAKYQKATADAKCAKWWVQVQNQQCGL